MGRGLTRQHHGERRRCPFVVVLLLRPGKAGSCRRRRKHPGGAARRRPYASGSGLLIVKEQEKCHCIRSPTKRESRWISRTKPISAIFGRHSQFDAYADADSVAIRLVRPGEDRREAVVHLHYGLLADVLVALAPSPLARDP